jgi:phosphate transport system substrate-binding protein
VKKTWLISVVTTLALLASGLPQDCLTTVSVAAAQASDGKTVVVSGATTVASLVQEGVQEFEAKQPGVRIILQPSTHGQGFDALLGRNADVCMTARTLSENELGLARSKGVGISEELLKNDAVAIVANPANPLDALSIPKLAKVFSGEYTNWQDVGGADEPIQVIMTSPEGGMASFLSKTVFKRPFTENPHFEAFPRRVPLWVSAKKGAIGFCRTDLAFGLVREGKVKILAIRQTESSPAIPLSEETMKDGSYPIMRALGLCYDRARVSPYAKGFVEFCQKKVLEPPRVAQKDK